MSKKLYHIPFFNVNSFIKENREIIQNSINNKIYYNYIKPFAKSYYYLEIQKFIKMLKIESDLQFAIKTTNYFNSEYFLNEVFKNLNLAKFDLKNITTNEFMYLFLYILNKYNKNLSDNFLDKLFLHYHVMLNKDLNNRLNHKEIVLSLIKLNYYTIKESFGEVDSQAFFKIFINEKLEIEEYGKSIKTLRKKSYKKLLDYF